MGNNVHRLIIKRIILIQIILILLLSIELFIFNVFKAEQIFVEILKYELLIIYIYSILSIKKYFKWTNLYLIFLLTLGAFIFSRIFLDILGMYNFYWANKWRDFFFPLNTQITTLTLLIISLLFIQLGVLLSYFRKREERDELKTYPALERLSIFLFFLSSPGIFIKYIIQLKFILQNGYMAVYNGALANLKYPFWTFGSGTLMEISYCLFLSSKPNKKKFLIISTLFFLLKIIDVLKGGRSKLFLPILFIAWFYYQFYSTSTIKFKKIIIYSFLGIIVSQFILKFRDSNNVIIDNGESFITIFFAQQGISLLVLSYMIFYKSSFINNGLPYILYPLTIFSSTGGQSHDFIKHTISLGHKLTYFLSPQGYLQGQGIGSSYLGELYDLGLIGFVFGSLVIGIFISYYEYIMKYSRIWLVLCLYIVQTIIYMPRASILPNAKDLITLLIVYFMIDFILKTYFKSQGIIKRIK